MIGISILAVIQLLLNYEYFLNWQKVLCLCENSVCAKLHCSDHSHLLHTPVLAVFYHMLLLKLCVHTAVHTRVHLHLSFHMEKKRFYVNLIRLFLSGKKHNNLDLLGMR